MKNLYNKEDILTYKTDEISLGTTVIIKTKWDMFKGKLTLNNKDCIAIDYPKELNGTYIGRDGIESIRVLGSFSDLMNLITKEGDDMEFECLEELIQLDEALTSLGKSDSSVEYAPHIREEFNKVIEKLNQLKVKMGYERFVNNSDDYFKDEE